MRDYIVACMQMTLTEAITKRNVRRDHLATLSGVHRSTIYRLERGDTRPSLDTVIALEDALGLRRGTLTFERQAVA